MPARPSAAVTVVPGHVITEAPPAVPVETLQRLRSAVALARSVSSPRELLAALGGMPVAELKAAAEAVSLLGDRVAEAAWLAEDAHGPGPPVPATARHDGG